VTDDLPTAVQDPASGLWAYEVQCPGEDLYRSPYIYDTERAALNMRALELQICSEP
jgi:hypothetical protein